MKDLPKFDDYNFIVAGHSYGSHYSLNTGLHPEFIKRMKQSNSLNTNFVILTGDFARSGNIKNFDAIERQFSELDFPYYLVMGNHDYTEKGIQRFTKLNGNTYYSFNVKTDKFIILDCQKERKRISSDQLIFLEKLIIQSSDSSNIFLFFHELLWNNNTKYKDLKSNWGSRYKYIQQSNFWTELVPVLNKRKDNRYYAFAGDVAGNEDAIPAFYDTAKNITLIASGMGEVLDENFLKVRIENGEVDIRVVPLNFSSKTVKITEYYYENVLDYHKPKKVHILKKMLFDIYYSCVKYGINKIKFYFFIFSAFLIILIFGKRLLRI